MRTLSATLTSNQKAGGRVLVRLVLTKTGQTTQTYGVDTTDRLLNINHSEAPYGQTATVVVQNPASNLTALDLRGYKGVISYGYKDAAAGDEYSATAPLWVVSQRLDSWPGGLSCTFNLIGTPDLLDQDMASENCYPDFTDQQTVKDFLRQIAAGGWDAWAASTAYTTDTWVKPITSNGMVYECTIAGTSGGSEPTWPTTEGDTVVDNQVTWTCRGVEIKSFNHCVAYTISFTGTDSLIDSFVPKDSFSILNGDSRLTVIKNLLAFTKSGFLAQADEGIHIIVPTTTGTVYDYEYKLSVSGEHTFFDKSHRERLMIPNYFVVSSHPDHANQYTGYSEDTDSSGIRAVRHYTLMRLSSNAQAADMAAAIKARHQWDAEKGSGNVPINVGQEVFDYVKFTDKRDNDDTRVGNVGYLNRKYSKGIFRMEIRFGSAPFGPLPYLTVPRPVEGGEGAPSDLEAVWDTLRKTWDFNERLLDKITAIENMRRDEYAWMLPVSALPFATDLVFTSVDWDSISWTAGTVRMADGRVQEIEAGTLDLTGTHYLYVVWGNRVLQSTTTYSDSVKSDQIVIGIAAKASTVNQKAYILIPSTDNVLINIDKIGNLSEVFGDGDDGDGTISANTNMSRDMFYNSLTVNANITLNTKGYRLFVKNTLTNNGTIMNNGGDGGDGGLGVAGTAGTAGASGSLGGGATGGAGGWDSNPTHYGSGGGGGGAGACLIAAKTIINNGIISANGGAGGDSPAGLAGTANGSPGSATSSSIGGSGGNGGNANGGGTGGVGGTATAKSAAQGGIRSWPMCVILKDETTEFAGGAGGGGGGVYETGKGGGGGGGGGFLALVYNLATWGTEQANGGAGGSKDGVGSNGTSGSNGSVLKLGFV